MAQDVNAEIEINLDSGGYVNLYYFTEQTMKQFANKIVEACATEAFNFWYNSLDANQSSAENHILKLFHSE